MQPNNGNSGSFTLPLEVGWGDVRELCLNDRITCQQVLDKLTSSNGGDSELGAAEAYAILEYVYDATNHLREIRKLDPNQPMYQLVPFVLAPKCSFERSVLVVVELGNEIVVFFNAYFRMLTGLPHEHLSFFPDAMMTVGDCEQMIKNRLGLSPQEQAKVGLHGNYGNCVTALESSLLVSTLKRTHDDISSPKFFQFQILANHADHELMGVSRASWLYVKEHKGIIHHERKLYAVLKGTTLFLYKSEDKRGGRYGVIDRIDECRVINSGHNALRTRHYVRLFHPSGLRYSLSSAYRLRINKWLTAFKGCHRILEVQDAVTASSLVGLPPEAEQNKRRRGKRIDPTNEGPEEEYTEVQRKLLEKPEDTLKVLQASAKNFNTSGIKKEQWLETIRLFLVTICELPRPGFACDVLPLIKDVLTNIRNYHIKESNNQEEVDAIVDICIRVMAVYKSFVMDEAPFPTDLSEDDRIWVPRMKEMRNKLSQTDYYCRWEEEACTTDDELLSVEAILQSIGPNIKKSDIIEADDEEYNGENHAYNYPEAELEPAEPLPMEEQVQCIQFPPNLPPPPSERSDQSKSVLSKMAQMFRKKPNSLDKDEEKRIEREVVPTDYPQGRQRIDRTTRINYDITMGNELNEFDAEDELEWNYQPKSRIHQRDFRSQYATSPMDGEEEFEPDEDEEMSNNYQNHPLNYGQQQFNNSRGRERLQRMSYQEMDLYKYDNGRSHPSFPSSTINKFPRARSYCDPLSEEMNHHQYQPGPIPNSNVNYKRTNIRGPRPQMRPLPGCDNGGRRMMMTTPRPMPPTTRNRRY